MTPSWWRRELEQGMTGTDVHHAQVLLGVHPSGIYDEETAIAARGVQHVKQLPVTGEVDEATAEVLGERSTKGLTPAWFTRDIYLRDIGPDVARLNELIERREGDVYTAESEAVVRRLQSENHTTPTGVVDEATAKILGD